jgi:aarF domain-containing kinase
VDIVVKVQHKGIKNIILQDLKNARTIVQWVAWAEPDYDFGPVMDEWCNEVPKELDFNLEAENTQKVAKNLDYNNKEVSAELSKSHVDVLVPEILQSTEKVLVMVYMDGVRLNDVEKLKELGVDMQALVESITRSYAHQIYVDGFFNADPHPGNFLVSKVPPFKPILLDFGLTKTLTFTKKQALAKMLLACAEGDYAALLSAFAEIGLKLRMDMPEDVMQVTNFFFRRSIPGKESPEDIKQWTKENDERKKRFQKKQKEEENGSSLHRNPVDAFPGDIVFFMRVLNLLRGLSSMLGGRVVYLEVMRPFAETALFSGNVLRSGRMLETESWVHKSPSHSSVETKLRELLLNLGREDQILGVQVCVYKDGQAIIDTAGGVLGKFDPRPVQPDSLFSCFSVTKGITAGLVHWLADQGYVLFL